jgi:hypothetical protein
MIYSQPWEPVRPTGDKLKELHFLNVANVNNVYKDIAKMLLNQAIECLTIKVKNGIDDEQEIDYSFNSVYNLCRFDCTGYTELGIKRAIKDIAEQEENLRVYPGNKPKTIIISF